MTEQPHLDYARIERAIAYIAQHWQQQPSLEEVASTVNLSPFHFQRLFQQWAGVSPKKFNQYLSLNHAKYLLKQNDSSLLATSEQIGLSSTSRLHDLFIRLEGMTPGEFKRSGQGLTINYSFSQSPFGEIFIASTPKGVCHLSFYSDKNVAINNLKKQFSGAHFQPCADQHQFNALAIFQQPFNASPNIKLHIIGSPFQLKVWECLLTIPMGSLSSYGKVAEKIDHHKASRAVGTAVGANPVAFLIPCHRVIRANGCIGQYLWGENKKSAMIGWEAAAVERFKQYNLKR